MTVRVFSAIRRLRVRSLAIAYAISTGVAGVGCAGTEGAPCESPSDCATDFYCAFIDDLCGRGKPGTCRGRPRDDPKDKPYDEGSVCGCDGVVYVDENAANAAGHDADRNDQCVLGPGQFTCGEWEICEEKEQQICVHRIKDPSFDSYFACEQSFCADLTDCTCIQQFYDDFCDTSECSVNSSGRATLTCEFVFGDN